MFSQFAISFPNQIQFFFCPLGDLIDQPGDNILATVKLFRVDFGVFADLRLEGLMILFIDFFFQIQKILFFSPQFLLVTLVYRNVIIEVWIVRTIFV